MSQIDEVRDKTDIVQLIGEYLPLKKTGVNYRGLCPFHTEKTPSFTVSPERQIYKCFGCGAGGNVFNFLMEYDGLEFGEALRHLAQRAGVTLRQYQPSKSQENKEALYSVNLQASEYYHHILTAHPAGAPARQYLKSRGITLTSVKAFKLGYVPNQWDNLIKYLHHKKKLSLASLEKASLILKSTKSRGYYDRFRGRLIFPLFDHRDQIVGFAGRILTKDAKSAKYINSPETLIYHKSHTLYGLNLAKTEIRKQKFVIITEGEVDVISSRQAGIKNIVAIKGSALTEDQLRLLRRYTDTFYLALDMDLAGDAAMRRGIKLADIAGTTIKVIQLTHGKDPDEAVRYDPETFRQDIKNAISVYDFVIDSSFRKHGTRSGEAKRAIGREAIPFLSTIDDEIMRADYLHKLAQKLGVADAVITSQAKKLSPVSSSTSPPIQTVPTSTASVNKYQAHLLTIYLQAKLYSRWPDIKDLITDRNLHKLGETLYRHRDDLDPASHLPAELTDTYNHFYLLNMQGIISREPTLEKEWAFVITQLTNQRVKASIEELSSKINQLEALTQLTPAEKKRLEKLEKELVQLISQLRK